MQNPRDIHLCLTVDAERIPLFLRFLAQGFKLRTHRGATVSEVLSERLGIEQAYLQEKVQTVFLNGSVLDDLQSARVEEGCVLALSAAMPGAAGAVLRKESRYARMRSELTHKGDVPSSELPDESVTVVVKAFNLIASDLGPFLVGQGILIAGEDLHRFLRVRWDDLKAGVKRAWLDKGQIDPRSLLEMNWEGKSVYLQVIQVD